VTSAKQYQMTIMHLKTGADLTFILAPTAELGPPVMFASQLAATLKKSGLKVGKVSVSKDGHVAHLRWRHRIAKKGQKTRWKRGITRVAMDRKVPTVSVVMFGRWPAKHHRLMRKEFRAYAQSLQVTLKTIMVK
jgi:hypothetical protein